MNWEQYKQDTYVNGCTAIEEYLFYEPQSEWITVFDDIFVDDSVTGNGSGSFTMSSVKAKKLVSELLWDNEALAAIKEMGMLGWPTDPEQADVVARCAALYEMASELEDYFNKRKEELEND